MKNSLIKNIIPVVLLTLLMILTTGHAQLKDAGSDTNGQKVNPKNSTVSENLITKDSLDVKWELTLSKILRSLLLFLIAFLAIRYFVRFIEKFSERWPKFRWTIKGAIPIVRILGWSLVLLFIIEGILEPPIQTLIALTASAGIAVGFAAQDILKNIFGGIMIIFDRPFQVGDKIQIGNHYGEVLNIGLRTVRIVTADDSIVSIPNSELVNQSVSNSNSGESNCQVVAEIYLPSDIDTSKTKQIAYRTAVVSRYIFLNKPIAVIFKNEIQQGRSLLKMRLKAYVFDLRYEFPFMSEMTETIMRELISAKLVTPEQLSLIPRQRA